MANLVRPKAISHADWTNMTPAQRRRAAGNLDDGRRGKSPSAKRDATDKAMSDARQKRSGARTVTGPGGPGGPGKTVKHLGETDGQRAAKQPAPSAKAQQTPSSPTRDKKPKTENDPTRPHGIGADKTDDKRAARNRNPGPGVGAPLSSAKPKRNASPPPKADPVPPSPGVSERDRPSRPQTRREREREAEREKAKAGGGTPPPARPKAPDRAKPKTTSGGGGGGRRSAPSTASAPPARPKKDAKIDDKKAARKQTKNDKKKGFWDRLKEAGDRAGPKIANQAGRG